ncbi:MAG: class I SAM-dependent methyltransferase family protein [Candidatus Hadarchaeales archaeon]
MGCLAEALRNVLSDRELSLLPGGFDRIGHVAVISLAGELLPRSQEIAGALLRMGGIRTVMLRERGVSGRTRSPGLKFLAGDPNTETLHRENGCLFKLDVGKVMFSTGNQHERARIAKLVQRGEVVLDMFAGVGQFTIPIARLSEAAVVYSTEINPVAFHYLCENVRMNRVGHRVRPILGDCAREAPKGMADRVVMGILHVSQAYIRHAIEALKPAGGIIHYHESVPSRIRFERPVRNLMSAAGGREIEILGRRVVKRYAPGVDHVVIDVRVGRR